MLSSIMQSESFAKLKIESEQKYLKIISDIHISEKHIEDMDKIYDFVDNFGEDQQRWKKNFELLNIVKRKEFKFHENN